MNGCLVPLMIVAALAGLVIVAALFIALSMPMLAWLCPFLGISTAASCAAAWGLVR